MKEIWKDIPGYEGLYQVSNLGRVKSLPRTVRQLNRGGFTTNHYKGKILKPIITKTGYLCVSLYKDHRTTGPKRIHRLVCLAFYGEPEKEKEQVNHKNGVKTDNRLENLEWCSGSENILHSYNTLLRKAPRETKVMCVETGEVFNRMIDAENKYGLCEGAISHATTGGRKTAGGFHWKKVR